MSVKFITERGIEVPLKYTSPFGDRFRMPLQTVVNI